jgi:hypothetical protein
MGEGHNFKQLRDHILARSKATDWDVARKEWALVHLFESEEPDTCPCGHFPIIEICVIANRVTKQTTEVGNVCVRRFLGFRSDLIFAAIKRIGKDTTKSLNADAIAFFQTRGLFTAWEYKFLQDTMKNRTLTLAQRDWRKKINEKVLSAIRRRGFQGPD